MVRLALVAIPLLVFFPVFAPAATLLVPSQYPTIQAGINAASAGDTVLVACGTYDEYDIKMKSGVHLVGEGGNCSDPCVTIEPVVSATNGRDAIVCSGVDDTASIEGLLISGRLQPAGSVSSGIRCTDSDVTILCCRVEYWKGSGISLTASSPLIKWTTCEGNGANASQGGGLYSLDGSPELWGLNGVLNSAGDGADVWCGGTTAAVLEYCYFTGGTASGYGGAVYCEDGVSMYGCTFGTLFGADAARGGGVACAATVSIDSCTISGCRAEYGAGVYVITGSVSISRTGIERCGASGAGGGIYLESGGLAVTDCTILTNDAGTGDGAGLAAASGTLDLSGVVIARGRCDGSGSGAWLSNATATLTGCTITGNRAGGTGGIHAEASVVDVQRTILTASCYGVPELTSASGSSVSLSCCDIDPGRVVESSGTVTWLAGNFFAPPEFCGAVHCDNTAGATPDYTVSTTSPALPANNTCGVQVGALGEACSVVSIESRSWGSIKAGYR